MQGIDSAVAPTDYIFWYNGHSFIIHSRISIAIIYIGSYNGWRSSPARDQTRFRRTRRDRSRPSLHVPALHVRSRSIRSLTIWYTIHNEIAIVYPYPHKPPATLCTSYGKCHPYFYVALDEKVYIAKNVHVRDIRINFSTRTRSTIAADRRGREGGRVPLLLPWIDS